MGLAQAEAGTPMPLVAGGAGAVGLGLVLIVIAMLGGKKRAEPPAQPSIHSLPTVESRPPIDARGETKLSTPPGSMVAAGTPSPVDSTSFAITQATSARAR